MLIGKGKVVMHIEERPVERNDSLPLLVVQFAYGTLLLIDLDTFLFDHD